MKRFILGLNGAAKSGKDTVADYLINERGWDGKLSFARNLKDMVREVFDLTEFDVAEQEGKERLFSSPVVFSHEHLTKILLWMNKTHGDRRDLFSSDQERHSKRQLVQSFIGTKIHTPREALQLVGTEICRSLVENYHIDIVLNQVKDVGNYVITDVRYLNEANFVRNGLGGSIIRIVRPSLSKSSDMYKHSSENSLNDWDGFSTTILNDEDGVQSLYKKIDNFLEEEKHG